MNKKQSNPKTLADAKKVIDHHAAEIEEMAHDVGQRMMRDQAQWLDVQMKDILPPPLYEAGLVGEKEDEIGEYLRKHDVRIIHISDSMALQITIGNRIHSRFVPVFTVDGEEVKIQRTMPDPGKN